MQILGLLGMYFDAVVVELKKNLLLFGLALAILCPDPKFPPPVQRSICSKDLNK